MEALIPIIVQAVSGMVGGGIAGNFVKVASQAGRRSVPSSPALWAAERASTSGR